MNDMCKYCSKKLTEDDCYYLYYNGEISPDGPFICCNCEKKLALHLEEKE